MTDPGARRFPDRPFLAASLAVFRDGRVLLAERADPPLEGLFTLPGGIVEPGESLAAAALREMREETGVEARILGFNDHVEIIERDRDGRVERHFVVASFVAAWVSGEGVVGPEARRIVWARLDEIAALRTTPGLAGILDRAARIFASP